MCSFSLLATLLLQALAAVFLEKGVRPLPLSPSKLFLLHEMFVFVLRRLQRQFVAAMPNCPSFFLSLF